MDEELRDKLTQAFLDSLAEAQERSGREAQEMTEDTIPLVDLVSFDSHNGVEAEILLSGRLGFEIEDIPFCAARRGSGELRVSEIVNALIKKYGAKITAALKGSREQTVAK